MRKYKILILGLLGCLGVMGVSAQQKTYSFNSDPGSGHFRAEGRIDMNKGFSWEAGDGQTRIMEIDRNYISFLNEQSQPYNGGYQSFDEYPDGLDLSLHPGSVSGSFTVSDNGSANYSIPIQVASGTEGVQPQLSVNYSSSAGFGAFGHGINLGGLSTLMRVPRTHYRNGAASPVQFDRSDQLIFKGQFLIYNGYGLYLPEVCSGNSYAVEQKVNDDVGEYFYVRFADGAVIELGNADNSRYSNSDGETYAYLITKYINPKGFIIEYNYINDNGNPLIKQIDYTKHNGGNGSNYPAVDFHSKVVFHYSKVSESRENYLFGTKRANNQVISQISCYSNDELYRSYWFDYMNKYDKTLLKSVSMQGVDGSMLNPTYFKWNDPGSKNTSIENTDFAFSGDDSGYIQGAGTSTNSIVIKDKAYSLPVRLNNDVYIDIVRVSPALSGTQIELLTSDGTTFSQTDVLTGFSNRVAGNQIGGVVCPVDADGDQNIDILTFKSEKVAIPDHGETDLYVYRPQLLQTSSEKFSQVLLHKVGFDGAITEMAIDDVSLMQYERGGMGFFEDKIFFQPIGSNPSISGDFDGDGKKETIFICTSVAYEKVTNLTYARREGGEIYFLFKEGKIKRLNEPYVRGTYGNLSLCGSLDLPIDLSNSVVIDIDGDGVDEVIENKTGNIATINATFESDIIVTDWPSSFFSPGENCQYGDLNNDGYVDKVFLKENGEIWADYNTGNEVVTQKIADEVFKNDNFPTFPRTVTLSGDMSSSYSYEDYHTYKLSIGDLDNDGVADVLVNVYVTTAKIHSKLLMGNQVMQTVVSTSESQRTVRLCSGKSVHAIDGKIVCVGDFNGDGVIETMTDLGVWKSDFSLTNLYVKDFIEGNGRKISIDERNMLGIVQNESGQDHDDPEIHELRLAIPAVTKYSVTQNRLFASNESKSSIDMEYSGILFHEKQGYLGTLMKISKISRPDGSIVEMRQEKMKHDIGLKKSEGYLTKPILLGSSVYNYVNGLNTSYLTSEYTALVGGVQLSNRTKYSHLKNGVFTTSYEYLGSVVNFNLSSLKQLYKPSKITKKVGLKKSVETEIDYNASFLPEQITKTIKYGDKQSVSTKTITYEGNRVKTLTSTLGNITKTLTLDFDGTSVTSTKSSSGTSGSLQKVIEFDASMRYPVSKTMYVKSDNGDDVVFTTLSEYDYTAGKLLKQTDANNLEVEYEYDAFGALIKSHTPDGEIIEYGYSLASSGGLKITTNSSFKGEAEFIYDNKNRLDNGQMIGYNNTVLTIDNSYDDENRTATLESFTSNLTSTQSFDEFGRISKIETGFGIQNLDYNGADYTATIISDGNSVSTTFSHNEDGLLTSIDNSQWGKIKFSDFDEFGNAGTTSVFETTTTTVFENGLQTSLDDPSAGLIEMKYNPDGSILETASEEEKEKGDSFKTKYDNIGRATEVRWNGGQVYHEYDKTFKGKVSSSSIGYDGRSSSIDYTYDELGRSIDITESFGSKKLSTVFTYTADGNVATKTFPNGFKLVYDYDGMTLKGIYRDEINADNMIWSLSQTDEYGKITESVFGNGCTNSTNYNEKQLIDQIVLANGDDLLRQFNYTYSESGNLLSRNVQSSIPIIDDIYEEFTYDAKDQLASINGVPMVYDDYGNITGMAGVARMEYGGANMSPFATSTIQYDEEFPSDGRHSITYTPWKKMKEISQVGSDKSRTYSFFYGSDFQRKSMKYKENGFMKYERQYFGDYEIQYDGGSSHAQFCYIYSPEGLSAVYISDAQNPEDGALFYLHFDRLGNLHTITNQRGRIAYGNDPDLPRQLFINSDKFQVFNTSAWGVRTWAESGEIVREETICNRGFTGHEHMYAVGLVNMNGRVYDPSQGRFLSPDPYVQDPTNPLNFNRYAYCYNNPFRYTDPSGNFIFSALTAIKTAVFAPVEFVHHALNGDNPIKGTWEYIGHNMGTAIEKDNIIFGLNMNNPFEDQIREPGVDGQGWGVGVEPMSNEYTYDQVSYEDATEDDPILYASLGDGLIYLEDIHGAPSQINLGGHIGNETLEWIKYMLTNNYINPVTGRPFLMSDIYDSKSAPVKSKWEDIVNSSTISNTYTAKINYTIGGKLEIADLMIMDRDFANNPNRNYIDKTVTDVNDYGMYRIRMGYMDGDTFTTVVSIMTYSEELYDYFIGKTGKLPYY